MLKSEVLKPKLWLTNIFDWALYWVSVWMVENAGSKNKFVKPLHQEPTMPPWAEKARKTEVPKQFKVKQRQKL